MPEWARSAEHCERGKGAVSPGTPNGGSKKHAKKKQRRKVADFPVIVSALESQLRTNRNADISCGIAGAKRLGDLKTYAERWLAGRKKQGHPLIPGTPMCDQVHSLLDLPPPPPHVAASASSS